MTKEDQIRVRKAAELLASRTRGVLSAEDLQHEAVMRTLSGNRKWAKEVPMHVYLINAMKSIASHARHPATEVEALEAGTRGFEVSQGAPGQPSRGVQVSEGLIRPDPANAVAPDDFSELLKSLKDRDDKRAIDLLEYIINGFDARETATDLGVTQTEYDTTLKRIRRTGERLGLRSGRRQRGGA